ncbi:unnamed protein product [Pocillopora meandrina]|uniref:Uncharacterized protein n=1 Tax=Pocillopora meandrina TaxID=46732 RepID=A0AAU9Y1U1_9CNID|nr:unnamed protein product [Pocillopora meandrina]
MGEKKKEEKMGMSAVTQQSNHQRKERKTSQNQSLWLKSLSLRRKRKYPTPASNLAAKAATLPETPFKDSKPSPKKTVTLKKEKKIFVRKLQPREHQKMSKSEEVVEIPPSLEKKKSGYHGFMARDGPRALGSKEIPQESWKVLRERKQQI